MKLEFHAAAFEGIGRQAASPDQCWAEVELTFVSQGHERVVRTSVLVPSHPNATLAELEQAARAAAKMQFAEAARLLEEHTLFELRQRQLAIENHDRPDWLAGIDEA